MNHRRPAPAPAQFTEPEDVEKFKVHLSPNKWQQIFPEPVTYSCSDSRYIEGRQYEVLRCGAWTHIINEAIWFKKKCQCTWVFKRAKVFPSGTKYLKINGTCKECRAKLFIHCDKKPNVDQTITLNCEVKNKCNHLHTGRSKRMLSGELHVHTARELCEGKKQPNTWRAAEALRLMDVDDPEPSHFHDLSVLRKAKHEQRS